MRPHVPSLPSAVVLLGLVASCGGSSDSGSKPSVTTVVERQTVTAPPATSDTSTSTPAPAPASSASSGSGKVKVPNEVGQRLDVAEDDLASKGLTFQEIGGGVVGIVVKSNWTVCQTKPTAGTSVSSGARVKLIVDRSC
jgi:hypothetical protein